MTAAETLKAIATHEAGHAVIARVVGIKGGDLRIDPAKRNGGADHTNAHDTQAFWSSHGIQGGEKNLNLPRIFRLMLIMLAAGTEAEKLALGSRRSLGDKCDRWAIDNIVRNGGILPAGMALSVYKRKYRLLAKNEVRNHLSQIRSIASLVEAQHRLGKQAWLSASMINCFVFGRTDQPRPLDEWVCKRELP